MTKYQKNGRPVIDIYQHGGPWTEQVFTIHTPNGIYRELSPDGVKAMLTSYPIRPSIECKEGVCGKARAQFRGAIAHMSLPEGLQQIPQV